MEVNSIIIGIAVAALLAGIFLFWQSRKVTKNQKQREKEMERRMYELAILKELGDRTGYSLNVQNIIDIITGSLHQFMEYSAVSYMLLQPEKIIFKVNLEKSVSRHFVDEIQDRMLKSLSALLSKEFKKNQVEELLTGAILVEEMNEPVKSYFNIPMVIGEKVVGILTIADTKADLYGEEETTILYKITQQASQAVSRLQEVIQTEQRKLNAMVSSMTEGVVMTDKDYRILVANPAIKRALGLFDKKEITIFDFIDNLEGKFDIRGKLEESVKLDKVLVADEVLIRDKYWQILVAPVKSNAGLKQEEVIGGVVIFHDITHDKELEKMRDDFTSMMVHELRSPLNGIKMLSQSMMGGKKALEKKLLDRNIDVIEKSSANMLTLVNDLLDAAKLEAGKFDIEPESTDIKSVISERVAFFQPMAQEKQIKLEAAMADSLPEVLNIDNNRIAQVFNNLISNAIKFTGQAGQISVQGFLHKKDNSLLEEADRAGIKWQVTQDKADLVARPDSVVIAVTDNGEGISQANQTQLFNKFVQFQSRKKGKAQPGTGLGLVIAKGIVEAHQGTIDLASQEGKGSTFYFLLPLLEGK
ncbi:PAS domain-containing protein [Patescibacteria group bacterium]|nr:PAS domain-containing protein [Patescibacteria group bacterium]